MKNSLRQTAIHGISWSLLESVGVQGVQFITGVVLARLLLPEQFGLIGMLAIVMAVAQSFLDSGFGAALIQKREATLIDTSSIFYFNVLVGIAAVGLLWLSAPWVAAFYNQPILTPLTRALSVTIFLNSLGLIQGTILIRQIDFKTSSKVSLIAYILSGIIGITLAATGFGVWSLVAQQISASFFRTLFLWLLNTWRPALIFSLASLREMFGFGSRLLASGLLDQIFSNIYLLVIGKLFTPADLGFFTRADAVAGIPSRLVSRVVGSVAFPVFSAIQDDPTRLKKGMQKALTSLVLVNFPLMIGLLVVARPLVIVLLGERWAESIPYLQLLCISGILLPVHMINLNLLQALGRSELFLRLELMKKVLVVINIAVTWRLGISAMICGMIVISIISYYLNSYYTGTLIGYPIQEQLRELSSYLIMAVLMGIGVYSVGLLPFPSYWLMLLVQIPVGVLIYLGLCRLFKLAAFMEIWRAGLNAVPLLRAESTG